jgi:glucose-1-phosphate thymidylyltransferase
MLAGVREILIITTPGDQHLYQELLKDGSQLGVSFKYEVQPEPKGLAQAFIIGEKFLDGESCLMILGDNIFHGSGLGNEIQSSISKSGAHIFTYEVKNPNEYGVLSLDRNGHPVSITEKPDVFISNLAVTGLYAFDSKVSEIAKSLVLSSRGEFEITSLLEKYLNSGQLTYTALSRGVAWLDTGNPKSLNDATNYIRVIEERTGLKIGCIEEIAFRSSWINIDQLMKNARELGKNPYSEYLMSLNFDQRIPNRI